MRRELWWHTNAIASRVDLCQPRHAFVSGAGKKQKPTEGDDANGFKYAVVEEEEAGTERSSVGAGRQGALDEDGDEDDGHADQGQHTGFGKLQRGQ